MVDKEKQIKEIKEFIKNNPSLSATETLKQLQDIGKGIRKTNFLKVFRESKGLPDPTKAKREASIPKKFIKVKPTKAKPIKRKPTKQLRLPVKIPFKQTKFGKIVKRIMDKHGISEKKAIIRARALLKIPKFDFDKLNTIDKDILVFFGY